MTQEKILKSTHLALERTNMAAEQMLTGVTGTVIADTNYWKPVLQERLAENHLQLLPSTGFLYLVNTVITLLVVRRHAALDLKRS